MLKLEPIGILELEIYLIPEDIIGKSIKQLALKDLKFTDEDFHFESKSIIGDENFYKSLPLYKWERLETFCQEKKLQPELFLGGIEPADIKQGAIGDCYFLAALAVLANQPKLVQKLFLPFRYNRYGIYIIKLFMKGKWVNVVIDDYIPLKRDLTSIFARSFELNETWVMLIEKAYAKYHGSYQNIVSGSIREAMEQLTGGHGMIVNLFEDPKYFSTNNEEEKKKKDLLFNDLLKWFSSLALLATSADQGFSFAGKSEPNLFGIVPNHAYSILNVKKVDGHRLLKLRNTWGRFEWSGAWSDDDTKNWTPKMKKKLNYVNSDDGQFWMSFDDYLKQFKYLYVCRIPPENEPVSIQGEWSKELDNCGGHMKLTTFFKNPQYKLTVPKIGPTRVLIEIQLEKEPDTSDPKKLSGIGLYVFKSESNKPITKIPTNGAIGESLFKKVFRESVELALYPNENGYTIIPAHFYADREDKFTINVYATRQVKFEEYPKETLTTKVLNGSWKGDANFGAHWNIDSFKKNPYYELKVPRTTEVNIYVKVPSKTVPFFPYIVKGSVKDKFLTSKYLKDPNWFALFPKNGKEFFTVDGNFNVTLDEKESPYYLVLACPQKIPSSEFSITLKYDSNIEITDFSK